MISLRPSLLKRATTGFKNFVKRRAEREARKLVSQASMHETQKGLMLIAYWRSKVSIFQIDFYHPVPSLIRDPSLCFRKGAVTFLTNWLIRRVKHLAQVITLSNLGSGLDQELIPGWPCLPHNAWICHSSKPPCLESGQVFGGLSSSSRILCTRHHFCV